MKIFVKIALKVREKKMESEETFWLEGCFKREGSDEVISGDNFTAKRIAGLSVDEIYKSYIEFFNSTLRAGETKRIFVSAKEGIQK